MSLKVRKTSVRVRAYIHASGSAGHLGTFTLSLHWMNLGNQPVEIIVEDVYLLVVPSTQTKYDPEEDAQRAYAAKMDRVANAEILNLKGTPETAVGTSQLYV